uniref:Uncharacterized protein n=1 Tax=Glossina austeni TaxID=7395 RepID=A0A1A9VT96_GLOAU
MYGKKLHSAALYGSEGETVTKLSCHDLYIMCMCQESRHWCCFWYCLLLLYKHCYDYSNNKNSHDHHRNQPHHGERVVTVLYSTVKLTKTKHQVRELLMMQAN